MAASTLEADKTFKCVELVYVIIKERMKRQHKWTVVLNCLAFMINRHMVIANGKEKCSQVCDPLKLGDKSI